MNFKNVFKRAILLLLSFAVVINVASTTISALSNVESMHTNNVEDDKLHYVSLGASNTNGYGHHGYLDDEIYEDPLAAPRWAFDEWEQNRERMPDGISLTRKVDILNLKEHGRTIVPRKRG